MGSLLKNVKKIFTSSGVTGDFAPLSSVSPILTTSGDISNSGTTTNPTIIPGLSFSLLANSTYIVRGVIRSGLTGGTTGSVFGINIPSDTNVDGYFGGRIATNDTYRFVPYVGLGPGGLSTTALNTVASNQSYTEFSLTLVVITAGTFDMIFASKANVHITTIYATSTYMEVIKLN